MLLHKLGDYERALAIHRTAVASWRELKSPIGLLRGLWASGYTQLSLDPAAALPFFEESLTVTRALNHTWFLGATMWGLGTSARYLGRHQVAAEQLEAGLTAARQISNPIAISATLLSLGQVERDRGHLARASAMLGEGLEIFQENAIPWGIINCLEELAAIALSSGRPEQAARLLGAAASQRDIVSQPRPPVDRPLYARTVDATRDALGEARFAALWGDGAAIRPSTAIALALSEVAELAAEQVATA
jgi:tetratricopeptide (TPR) repeat protein